MTNKATVIEVVAHKGGVTKTTLAAHLAAGLAARGQRVLAIDTDSQGDLAKVLGMQPADDLYAWLVDKAAPESVVQYVPNEVYSTMDEPSKGELYLLRSSVQTWSIPVKERDPFVMSERIAEIAGVFDTIVIDTAPTLSMLDSAVYLAGDKFLLATECEFLSMSGVHDTMAQIEKFGARRQQYNIGKASSVMGIKPNKFQARTRNHRANIALLELDFPGRVWTPITHGTKWSEAQNFARLIWAYAPGGREAREADEFVNQALAVLHV